MGQRMSLISSTITSLPLVIAALYEIDNLLCYPHSTGTWIILLQNKSQTEHDRRSHGKNHKSINVCQARSLRLQGLINPRVGRYLRFVLAHARVSQVLSQTVRRIDKI